MSSLRGIERYANNEEETEGTKNGKNLVAAQREARWKLFEIVEEPGMTSTSHAAITVPPTITLLPTHYSLPTPVSSLLKMTSTEEMEMQFP